MSESSEVVGGGTSVAAPDVLATSAPVEEGRGGTTPEDAPLHEQAHRKGNQLDQEITKSYE